MIKIKRAALPVSITAFHLKDKLAADGVTQITSAERELERAVVFFTSPLHYANEKKLTKKTFAFAIYKDALLAEHMEAVFHNKCAYCESRFAHVTPKDVEHFRPKSEINTGSGVLAPGYYWLAGDWDNLLVSCPDCNRARKHKVPNQPKAVLLGKETQFPLSDEKRRVRQSGPLKAEDAVRLLLNPCTDDPDKHLAFDDDGLIHPRQIRGKPSPRGEASITVYALQRKRLVEERKRVLNDLKFVLDELEQAAEDYHQLAALNAPAAALTAKQSQILRVKKKLEEMFSAEAPYLAMLRQWLDAKLTQGAFGRLKKFGIDLSTLL